jgi:putative transposase
VPTRAVSEAASLRLDEVLAERIKHLIEQHPTFGYRRLWALLRFAEGIGVKPQSRLSIVTRIPCGADGWGHLAAVIDCHDREIAGFEFALRGRAKEAERALEEACLMRFGTLRPDGATLVIRGDNGRIFQSRRFRAACPDYRLRQEFTTRFTPEQNGIVERFLRSLEEECVWLYNFADFAEARTANAQWIEWYNIGRPR